MGWYEKNNKIIWASIASFITAGFIFWFTFGTNMIIAAVKFEKAADQVPVLADQMTVMNSWIKNKVISDSLLLIDFRNERNKNAARDKATLALYRYLKIWPPDLSEIQIPQKIN